MYGVKSVTIANGLIWLALVLIIQESLFLAILSPSGFGVEILIP